jgi:aspartyl-tRNA(Asn)/glutamyl-tRNA(Gln) amidotransferase subunit C
MPDIKAYENMAMLDLPDDEREAIGARFDAVTGGFEAIENVDTKGVAPLVTVLDLYNILREDVCEKCWSRDEILAGAPEQCDGYFQVPGTI